MGIETNTTPAQNTNFLGLSDNASGLIGAGLTGLGGLFPTSTNGNQNTTSQQNTSTEQNTNSQTQLQQLLQLLQTVSSNQNTQGTGTTTTTPNLSPENAALLNQLTNSFSQLTKPNFNGYQQQQIQGVNNTSNLQKQAVDAIMAGRGLTNSPVAATAAAGVQQNRLNQVNQVNQSIPLLQNQQALNNLSAAAAFQQSIPKGTTTSQQSNQQVASTQDTNSQQNQQQYGQNWGYQQGNTGTTGSQQVQSTQKQGGGVGGAVGGLLSTLGGLFLSDKRLKKEITSIPSKTAAERIMKLKPVSWKWKDGEMEDEGILAQDVKKEFPELVNEEGEHMRVNYTGLVANLIGAVQEINKAVNS